MNWSEICAHPALQNLPFKIEQDRWGHIVMRPATNCHSRLQSLIARVLDRNASGGESFVECAVTTPEGTKVADVASASEDFLRRHGLANPYPEAPEIVIEVLSVSNTRAEMEEKRALYFGASALECWICADDGRVSFFDESGPMEGSRLVPGFPGRVELPFG